MYLILLVIGGIISFGMFFHIFQVYENLILSNLISSDTLSYIKAAQLLYYSFEPHYVRPMGYPLLIGMPLLFTNNPIVLNLFILFINLSFWILTLVLVFKTLSLWLSSRFSFFLTIPLAFSVGSLAIIPFALTEITYSFFITLISYLILRFAKTSILINLIIATSLTILLIIIKPGAVYLSIILFTYLVYTLFKSKKKVSFFSIASIFISLGLVAIQLIMMNNKYHKITVSFIDKITWYNYLSAQVDTDIHDITLIESKRLKKETFTESLVQNDSIFKSDLINKAKTYPFLVIKHYINNLISNSTGKSNVILIYENLNKESGFEKRRELLYKLSGLINKFFTAIMIILVIVMAFYYKNIGIESMLILGFVLYNSITSGISHWQGDRFSMVCYPLLIILTGIILPKLNTIKPKSN